MQQSLTQLGGQGGLRKNSKASGLAVTSYGSLVLDMRFNTILDVAELNALLSATPGVVEHGVFYRLASAVLLANNGVFQEIQS